MTPLVHVGICIILLATLYSLIELVEGWIPLKSRSHRHESLTYRISRLNAAYKPITYQKVTLPYLDNELLVKAGADDVLQTLSTWTNSKDAELAKVDEWIASGKAFWSTPQGTRDMHRAEVQTAEFENKNSAAESTSQPFFRSRPKPVAVDMYINHGTDENPLLVKTDSFSDTLVRKINPSMESKLLEEKIAYRNITQLLEEEKMRNRADFIAKKLNSEYCTSSEEWAIWTNKTAEYGVTSLTEVLAVYQRECSIGDIGGKEIDYVPQRGYIGTLAPGEKYVDQNPTKNQPKRILHPWPAAQEFQWYVRMPVTHPLVPPGPLLAALNGMYDDNYTYHVVNTPCDEIRGGGSYIRSEDAVRIAQLGNIGRCYEPEHQLKHGGMKFDYGKPMKGYAPDHGPTYSYEESLPKVPERLRPIVQKFIDPLYGLEVPSMKLDLEDHEIDDAKKEENERRLLMQQIIGGYEEVPLWKLQYDAETAALDEEVETRYAEQRAEYVDMWEPDDESVPYPLAFGLEYLESPNEEGISPYEEIDGLDDAEEIDIDKLDDLTAEEKQLLKQIDDDDSTVVFRSHEGISDEITGFEILKKDEAVKYKDEWKQRIRQERLTTMSWWEAATSGSVRGTRDVITYVVHTASELKGSKNTKSRGGRFQRTKRRRRKGEDDGAAPKGRPKRAPRKNKTRTKKGGDADDGDDDGDSGGADDE